MGRERRGGKETKIEEGRGFKDRGCMVQTVREGEESREEKKPREKNKEERGRGKESRVKDRGDESRLEERR